MKNKVKIVYFKRIVSKTAETCALNTFKSIDKYNKIDIIRAIISMNDFYDTLKLNEMDQDVIENVENEYKKLFDLN